MKLILLLFFFIALSWCQMSPCNEPDAICLDKDTALICEKVKGHSLAVARIVNCQEDAEICEELGCAEQFIHEAAKSDNQLEDQSLSEKRSYGYGHGRYGYGRGRGRYGRYGYGYGRGRHGRYGYYYGRGRYGYYYGGRHGHHY